MSLVSAFKEEEICEELIPECCVPPYQCFPGHATTLGREEANGLPGQQMVHYKDEPQQGRHTYMHNNKKINIAYAECCLPHLHTNHVSASFCHLLHQCSRNLNDISSHLHRINRSGSNRLHHSVIIDFVAATSQQSQEGFTSCDITI